MNNLIFAIDPGNVESGYVVVEHDGNEIVKVLECGKLENEELCRVMGDWLSVHNCDFAIEMIASYGMSVGREVFDTCVWIGRFWQYAVDTEYIDCGYCEEPTLIYRKDEKLNICGTLKAKDTNIKQALVDRYAPGEKNDGKGTKKKPGFFYGFKADIWQAFAVAVTYFDLHVKGKT